MIQLVKKIILLISIIYLLNILIAYSLDTLYEKDYSNSPEGVLNYYLKTQKTDILLVGSSFVLNQLNPSDFGQNSFNLSRQGVHIGFNTGIIDLLDKSNKLPEKTLILHIDPDNLNYRKKDLIAANLLKLKYYYHKNSFIKENINSISTSEHLKYYLTVYRHNGHVLQLLSNLLSNKNTISRNKGFAPLKGTDKDSLRVDNTYKRYVKNSTKYTSFNNKILYYIDHIQSICKKHNLKLIVLSTPFYKTPKNIYDCSLVLEDILRKRNIPYLNYLNDTCSAVKSKKYWYDNFHLKQSGAKIFSKIVAKDVLEID